MACIENPAPPTEPPGALQADLTPSDRLLARRAGVAAGVFRAAAERPEFAGSRGLSAWYLVFPRNFTEIRCERRPAIIATPAQLMLYTPGEPYRRRSLHGQGDHSDYLALDAEALLALQGELGLTPQRRFPVQSRPLPSALIDRQRLLFRQLQQSPQLGLATDDALLGLAREALQCAFAADDSVGRREGQPQWLRQRRWVELAKEHLLAALEHPPGLQALGDALHVSPFHLARIFRRHTGYTLHGFVLQQRLRLGYDQLLDSRRRIADVAEELGFSHHSHFTTQFSREFARSPRELRRIDTRSG